MARKSSADLAVVPLEGGGRPPPPADLDAAEQTAWRAVVDASPAYAIDPAAQLVLRRLVAQAALCERHEARLRALRARDQDQGEDAEALATAHAAAAKAVMVLLTSLRATPRSKTRVREAESKAGHVPAERPWEDGLSCQ
jgi:hypothetical protein